MKKIIVGTFVLVLLVLVHASPALATISQIFGPPGELCTTSAPCSNSFDYPVLQGRTIVLTVNGQFVDLSTSLEVSGSGVTVSSASGTTSSNKKISIAVSSSATPGLRTIKLHYLVETNGPDVFQVRVIRSGKVTSVPNVQASDYFTDVDVALNGVKLDNAGVFVLPTTIATFTVGGGQVPQVPQTLTQTNATAVVKSSSSDQTVVTVHFNGGPFAEAQATLVLFDKQLSEDTCRQHRIFCYSGLDDGSTAGTFQQKGQSTFNAIGPNAVSSISYPLGTSVSPGSVLTIRITLVRPAKSGGEIVHWQMVPSTSFVEAPGSGTHFSPTGQNSITVPGGDQFKEVSVRYDQVPAGCGRSGCIGQVQTRMVNFNTDQPPFLRLSTFTLLSR
ncbi:MAG: hypothetical protein C5B55_02695 [Blastocatellia bacterium]|nr:MAG: hypothetical protein C5B55_02695 [Blastocatellia bacterium]